MFIKAIAIIADFIICIPFFLFFFIRPAFTKVESRQIALFVGLTFLRNASTFITMELNIYNIFLYNWHNLLGFIVMAILYYNNLHNRYFKLFALVAIVISLLIGFLDYESLFDIKTVNFSRFSYNTSGCFTIILILLYFYELIQRLQVPNLTKYPLFWFSTGALLYYAGTIFSYIFIEITFNSTIELRQQYWMIDAILSIVFYFFISLSVWYMKPVKSSAELTKF